MTVRYTILPFVDNPKAGDIVDLLPMIYLASDEFIDALCKEIETALSVKEQDP
jgi:hypothetical protein